MLFLKQGSLLSKTYQYGKVVSAQQNSDDVIRKMKVKYRNANENVCISILSTELLVSRKPRIISF